MELLVAVVSIDKKSCGRKLQTAMCGPTLCSQRFRLHRSPPTMAPNATGSRNTPPLHSGYHHTTTYKQDLREVIDLRHAIWHKLIIRKSPAARAVARGASLRLHLSRVPEQQALLRGQSQVVSSEHSSRQSPLPWTFLYPRGLTVVPAGHHRIDTV